MEKTLATLDTARLPTPVRRMLPTLCEGGFVERAIHKGASVNRIWLGICASALMFIGCGGGGTSTPTVDTPTPTISLSAPVTHATQGATVTLAWSSTNATAVTASGQWSGTLPLSGTKDVVLGTQPTQTYIVTAANGTKTATSQVVLTADAPTPPTASLSVSKTSALTTDAVTITWATTAATTVTATGDWSGSRAANGSETITFVSAGTKSYTLTATGNGLTATSTVTVTVTAPPPPPTAPTLTLSASKSTAAQGDTVTLAWTSANATTMIASDSWSGPKAVSGTQDVTVSTLGTATFTLTAGNMSNLTTSAQVLVVVTAPLPAYFAVPDAAFAAALASLGVPVSNGQVATIDAAKVTTIVIDTPQNIASIQGVEAFTNLTHLQVEHQKLTSVDLSHNTALTWLSLWDNLLTTLDVTPLVNLTLLGTSRNDLHHIDLSTLAKVVELDLNHDDDDPSSPWGKTKGLLDLDITHNPALVRIYIGQNRLTTIDTTQNPLLEEFWAGGNQFTHLDFSTNHHGWVFDLYNNNLSYLNVKGIVERIPDGTNQPTPAGVPRTMETAGNPNLLQIWVENVSAIQAWAATYPGWYVKDPQTVYVQ